MAQDDGNRMRTFSTDVNEVNQDSILGAELREAVDACFSGAPVKVVLPVRHQLAEVRAVDVI